MVKDTYAIIKTLINKRRIHINTTYEGNPKGFL